MAYAVDSSPTVWKNMRVRISSPVPGKVKPIGVGRSLLNCRDSKESGNRALNFPLSNTLIESKYMSENKTTTVNSSGGSLLGLLGIVFVILKLNPGGRLDSPVEQWSWWLVTMPFWIGAVIVIAILIIGAFGVAVFAGLEAVLESRRRKRRAKENRAKLGL